MAGVGESVILDLRKQSLRQVNQYLHEHSSELLGGQSIQILHPAGHHSVAAGLNTACQIDVQGHVGYYAAGMNRQATITVYGNAGCGVAENMLSGQVRINGNTSTCAGATAHGGLLIIEGNAASRCGISLKGADIVVGGSVGHMSGFMAQAGRIVICGDAGHGLGDSLYEAVIYVRGQLHELGADAERQDMTDEDISQLANLLAIAQFDHKPQEFQRIGSARTLYHWNPDTDLEY